MISGSMRNNLLYRVDGRFKTIHGFDIVQITYMLAHKGEFISRQTEGSFSSAPQASICLDWKFNRTGNGAYPLALLRTCTSFRSIMVTLSSYLA